MPSPLVYFQIATTDPARTRAFLGELFDWPPAEDDDPLAIAPGGPADFDVNGQVMPAREGVQSVTLYFRVADLAATMDRAVAMGAREVMPITDAGGVHIAMIRTPDDDLNVGIVQA